MTDTQTLLAEIERRSRALFERLAHGDDAPPSMRLRLEGLLEATRALGVDVPVLQALIDEQHRKVFGITLAELHGADWTAQYPFPEVPALMRRAPVVPSTRD